MGKFQDLTGIRFGRLTVVSRAEGKRRSNGKTRTTWNCICDCGNEVTVNADTLKRGSQLSCGCYRKDSLRSIAKTHGMTDTRLYSVWCGIRKRCYSKTCREYKWYGERGIVMCDEWYRSFESFYEWAMKNGYDENAPRGEHTIDRIDVNGNYSPENCRIVSQLEQMNNIRTNHLLEYNGETHTIAEWARITGISQYKICNRVSRLGWTVERALETV